MIRNSFLRMSAVGLCASFFPFLLTSGCSSSSSNGAPDGGPAGSGGSGGSGATAGAGGGGRASTSGGTSSYGGSAFEAGGTTGSGGAPSGSGGDAGPGGSATGTPRNPAYNGIYVANGQTVRVFSLAAQGNTAPTRTLSGPSTMLVTPRVTAVDSVGEVLVGNEDKFGYLSTLVYPSLASGDVAPLRTLSVSGGMSGNPIAGIALGQSDDVWVAQYNAYHFPARATASDGSIASGPNLVSIAATAAGDVLLATSGGIVTTYAVGDAADASTTIPVRTLVTGKIIRSIAVTSDTLFVLGSTGAIDEFPLTARGSAAAAATISSPATALQTAQAIAVDAAVNPPILYVAADDATSGTIYDVALVGSAPAYTAGTATALRGALTTLTSAENVFVVHY